MSKNEPQLKSKTFGSIFIDSCKSLFSPSSDSALLNYDKLKFIDTSHLQFIDKAHFKFVDVSHLQLVNLTALLVGLKYVAFVGAYMFVLGGFGLSYMSVKAEEYNYQVALERDQQYKLAMLNEKYQIVSGTHVAYAIPDESVDSAVLGASDSRVGADNSVGTDLKNELVFNVEDSESVLPSCSFNVDGDVYASGSSLAMFEDEQSICVNYSGDSVDWYVRGSYDSASSSGDCYQIPNGIKNATVVVNVFDLQSELVGSCS